MEIREKCQCCENSYLISYKCDNCSQPMNIVPIHVEFGYGSSLDGTAYDFCTLKCLEAFAKAEAEKGGI